MEMAATMGMVLVVAVVRLIVEATSWTSVIITGSIYLRYGLLRGLMRAGKFNERT